jgi:hypothetical protein
MGRKALVNGEFVSMKQADWVGPRISELLNAAQMRPREFMLGTGPKV